MNIRNEIILFFAIVVFSLHAAGCATGSAAAGQENETRSEYSATEDAALKNRIRQKIYSETRLADARLQVVVEQRKVTVTGTVSDRRDIDLLERMIREIEDVRGVTIRVRETRGL